VAHTKERLPVYRTNVIGRHRVPRSLFSQILLREPLSLPSYVRSCGMGDGGLVRPGRRFWGSVLNIVIICGDTPVTLASRVVSTSRCPEHILYPVLPKRIMLFDIDQPSRLHTESEFATAATKEHLGTVERNNHTNLHLHLGISNNT
jgi:hypothetical protein